MNRNILYNLHVQSSELLLTYWLAALPRMRFDHNALKYKCLNVQFYLFPGPVLYRRGSGAPPLTFPLAAFGFYRPVFQFSKGLENTRFFIKPIFRALVQGRRHSTFESVLPPLQLPVSFPRYLTPSMLSPRLPLQLQQK